MRPFLERYYDLIDDRLQDPSTSIRYSKTSRYEDLLKIDEVLCEWLLNSTGVDSELGSAEAPLVLRPEQSLYSWPPGYRKFLGLELRSDTVTPPTAVARLGSLPLYSESIGIRAISPTRGFRLQNYKPVSEQVWTLLYLRGPGRVHHAKASDVTALSLTSAIPEENAGELVRVDNYYNGMELRIYKAERGEDQTQTVRWSVTENGLVRFIFEKPWDIVPEGDVHYEICPMLTRFDSYYAVEAALIKMGARRTLPEGQQLLREREDLLAAARNWLLSGVSDRAPTKLRPIRAEDRKPSEVPY